MKILLTAAQTREVDKYTIQKLQISSVELMERAARAFVEYFCNLQTDLNIAITICCGQGNNGGDGLAIARLLNLLGYHDITVYQILFSDKSSADQQINLQRLKEISAIKLVEITNANQFVAPQSGILIDALLGSGLNKPLQGEFLDLIRSINQSHTFKIAVDSPTGFFSEGELKTANECVEVNEVVSFQRPKLNFFFPESKNALQSFKVVDIGLDETFIQSKISFWKLIDKHWIKQQLKPRERFSHKGVYGHALLVAGSKETMGAAILASSACLYSGAGLVTASIPLEGLIALNVRLPEVMFLDRTEISELNLDRYQAIAIGPGLGKGEEQVQILKQLLKYTKPLVLDADALNILATHPEMLFQIPVKSILTPHVKEFDRLFGKHQSWWQRLETARKKAAKYQIVIVLKNQYTFVCLPSGDVCINQTGNPAMAQGGMGDVLTGIITSFVAQGYTSELAVCLAVYFHGKAGDDLTEEYVVVTASELAKQLPKTIKEMIC